MSNDTIDEFTSQSENQAYFNSKGPDAPIAWYGGKHYLARWIIEQMPYHRVYVEPFGGMAGVLLKKEPSEVEVFNDLDGRVVNFFSVIRDREMCDDFKRRTELTPYSREEFRNLCETPSQRDLLNEHGGSSSGAAKPVVVLAWDQDFPQMRGRQVLDRDGKCLSLSRSICPRWMDWRT